MTSNPTAPLLVAPFKKETCTMKPCRLTELPDEVIAMCFTELSVPDLVTLEHVSNRLRTLIATDTLCWKRCVSNHWKSSGVGNMHLLPFAAIHAGGWKQLYGEKVATDVKYDPWLMATKSEIQAIIDIIAGPLFFKHGQKIYALEQSDSSLSSYLCGRHHDYNFSHQAPILSSSPISIITNMSTTAATAALSIVVLLDASSSVTPDDFNCMKKFAVAIATTLSEQCVNAYMSVIQFNQQCCVQLNLTSVNDKAVVNTVEKMKQLMGSTDIAGPIRRARQILRDDSNHGDGVIVLVTDGQTHEEEISECEREARQAVNEGQVRIYTLGVGKDVDDSGLTRIASICPVGAHFTLRRFRRST